MIRVSSFLKDLPRWLMMITATMNAMATVPNTPTTTPTTMIILLVDFGPEWLYSLAVESKMDVLWTWDTSE